MVVFFFLRFTGTQVQGIPDLQARWAIPVADGEAIASLCVVVALLALLSREQQQTARERAVLAGEMQAASEIQHMLAPRILETSPALQIDVAFHPMRDVGGDFYLCRVLANGRQRVLIGDVSGKGAAAAMTAALLLEVEDLARTSHGTQLYPRQLPRRPVYLLISGSATTGRPISP